MMHIDHEAELYALGMLDEPERARIDDHIATCDPCLKKIGAAESAVTELVDVTQHAPQERARTPRWPFAVAAAFALTSLGLLGQTFVLHGALDKDGALLATMVNSHFNHEQFASPAGAPVAAKAIYERHGKWYQILADGTPAWHVVFVQPDGTRNPAPERFGRRDKASILISSPATPVRTIELDDADNHVVGIVKPTIAGEKE